MTLEGPGQSRRRDPWTAAEAAAKVRPGSARRALLEAHAANPNGLTDEEAAMEAGLSLQSEYATRCSELKWGGLLFDTGMARVGAAGMARMIRRITPNGLAALGIPGPVSGPSESAIAIHHWRCTSCQAVVPPAGVDPSPIAPTWGYAHCPTCGRGRTVRMERP